MIDRIAKLAEKFEVTPEQIRAVLGPLAEDYQLDENPADAGVASELARLGFSKKIEAKPKK
jgi:hypothetical protein